MSIIINYSDFLNDDGAFERLKQEYKDLGDYIKKASEQLRMMNKGINFGDSEDLTKFREDLNNLMKLREKYGEQEKKLALMTEMYNKIIEEQNKKIKDNTSTVQDNTSATNENARSQEQSNKVYKDYNELSKEIGKTLKGNLGGIKDTAVENVRLKNSLSQVNAELKTAQKSYEISPTQKLKEEIQKLTVQQTTLKGALQESSFVLKNQVAEANAATGSLEQMRRQLSLLTVAWKNASPEAAFAIEGQMKALNDLIKEAERGAGNFQRNVGNYPAELSGNLNEVLEQELKKLEGLGGEFGSMFGKVASSIGAGGLAIGAAVGATVAWAKGVHDITVEFTDLRGEIQKTTKAQGSELDNLTTQTVALQKTFGDDRKQIIKAQNALMNEFKISASEAFEILESGYLSAANANGDMLDSIVEYSSQVKASGGSARQLISILDSSGKQGIFSDKGIDTVKEFGLRIREQSKATKKALEDAFGKQFSDNLLSGISDGSITSVQGLQMVAKAMNDTSIPAEKLQTVIADVFGGAGEDAGVNFLKSLKDVSGETKRVYDLTNVYVRLQKDQLAVEKSLAEANNELAKQYDASVTSVKLFGKSIQVGLKKTFVDLSLWTNSLASSLKNAFTGGGANWKIVFQELTGGIAELTEAEKESISQTRTLNEMREISSVLIKDEIFDLNNKLSALHNSNLTEAERNSLMQEITNKYPQYLQYMVDEGGNLIELTQARKSLNAAIIESAITRTREAMVQSTMDKIIEAQTKSLKEQQKIQEQINAISGKSGRLVNDLLASYELELEETRKKSAQEIDLLTKDLSNFDKNTNNLFKELSESFGSINLSGGVEIFDEQIKNFRNEIKTIKVELLAAAENKDKLIGAGGKSGFDKIVSDLNRNLAITEKNLDNAIQKRNDFLGIKTNTKTNLTSGTTLEEGGASTDKTKVAELDLIEEIRRRRLEMQEETYKRDIELLDLKTQKELKSFEKLRQEQDTYLKKGLISISEYNRRIDEINQISEVAEQERVKAAINIRAKYYDLELSKFKDNLDKKHKLELAQYKIDAIEEGKTQEKINEELLDKELANLQVMYDKILNERIARETEISELRAKENLTQDEEIRLLALEKAKDLTQEEHDIRLKISELSSKYANDYISKLNSYNATLLRGQIYDINKEIEAAHKQLFTDEFYKLSESQKQAAIANYKELLDARKKILIEEVNNQFDYELQKYEEGSVEYLRIEEEKRQALLKINDDYNKQVETSNNEVIKKQSDAIKQLMVSMSDFGDKLIDNITKAMQKSVDLSQKLLEKQNKAVEYQMELAKNGMDNTLIYEIAQQEKREAELAKAQKRMEQMEKAKAFYAAFTTNVQNSKNSGEALMKTVADMAKLEVAMRAISGLGFEKGGYTGDVGTKDVAGHVHGKEFVLDAPTTKALDLKGKTTNDFWKMYNKGMFAPKGLMDYNQISISSKTLNLKENSNSNSDVVMTLNEIKEVLKNSSSADLDKLAKGIISTKSNNGNFVRRNSYINR